MKHVRLFVFSLLLCVYALCRSAECVESFEVRVIYFQPTNAPAVPTEQIRALLTEVQNKYGTEIERHGYEYKTFRIEREDGIPIIHMIKGKHNAFHYLFNTYERMRPELPREFQSVDGFTRDRVHLFIVGGMNNVDNTVWGFGWPIHGWRTGGVAVVAGNRMSTSLIAHELGHAFGLYHTDIGNAIMGSGDDVLLAYEARWLNKSHYFNDVHVRNNIPEFVLELPSVAVGGGAVKFRIVATSDSGLYHCHMCRKRNVFVVGSVSAEGNSDVIEIEASRGYLIEGDEFWFQIMDIYGNFISKYTDRFIFPDDPPDDNEKPKTNPNDKNAEPEVEPEVPIIEECPGCVPNDKDMIMDDKYAVRTVFTLTTQWGRLKIR